MEQSENSGRQIKEIYVKGILMATTLLLLVAALLFLTTAWYTKMVSTSGINLQAAQWDFTANHTVDAVTVNVYEYTSLKEDRAAPGAEGFIPIDLGARQSQTDIRFYLTVERDSMSEEFQDRIFFYFYEKDDNSPDGRKKVYFDISPEDYHEGKPSTENTMSGIIEALDTTTVYIYWEWLYEHPEAETKPTDQEVLDWDVFDTMVGEDPERFAPYMNATVTVAGVEVNPEETEVTPRPTFPLQ